MSVELDPAELGFRRPFTQEVAETLHLSNHNDRPVAFKVKTTAPKQYCVRPNSGRIEPGQHVEISVLLQAMKENPPADAKCRDKFLVQSVTIAPELEKNDNITAVWTAVEKAGKEGIKERKIRVNWLAASDDAGAASAHLSTPSANGGAAAVAGSPHTEPQPFNTPSRGGDSMISSTPSAVAASSTIGDVATTTKEALQQKLDAANVQIAQLTEQAKEAAGLRQRKVGTGAGEKTAGAATTTKAEPAGGVAVPIVAVLCLLSFLLAYFFF